MVSRIFTLFGQGRAGLPAGQKATEVPDRAVSQKPNPADEQGIEARQQLLYAACGPFAREVLDATARVFLEGWTKDDREAFTASFLTRLATATPAECGRFLVDLYRCEREVRHPVWRQRKEPGIDPTALSYLGSGNLHPERVAKHNALRFTEAEAKELLLFFIGPDSTRQFRPRLDKIFLKPLAQAFSQPDEQLASIVRNTLGNGKVWEPLLNRLCPVMAAEAALQKPERKGNRRAVEAAEAMDALELELRRLPGLWVRVRALPAAGGVEPTFDHQLHPYLNRTTRVRLAVDEAMKFGVDVGDTIDRLAALHDRGMANLAALKAGNVVVTSLDDVLASVPEGEKVNPRNIYWMRAVPEDQHDLFDAKGRPKLGLIHAVEQKWLAELGEQIAGWRAATVPALAVGGENRRDLVQVLSNLLAEHNDTKPTKSWIKQAKADLGQAELAEILGILAAHKPDGSHRSIHEALVYAGLATNRAEFAQEQMVAMAWAAHLAPATQAAPVLEGLAQRCFARKPGQGIANARLGNAAARALAMLPEGTGLRPLSRLRDRAVFPAVRQSIDRILAEVAKAQGISPDTLAELTAPDHGVIPGTLELPVGQGKAVIAATGSGATLTWHDATGAATATVPKSLREVDAAAVRTAHARLKEIGEDLTLQKVRIEGLLRRVRNWDHDTWRASYADHGTVGLLARRLLWQAETADGPRVVLPVTTGAEDATGAAVDLTGAQLSLWHPLDSTEVERARWRQRLADLGIVQPFRQAWRETYAFTPAEADTATYSNRFAGHVLRQHQMMALATAQGWSVRHLVGFDTANDVPAHLRLPDFGLQAELRMQPAGADCPVTDGGAYRFVVTDRILFHRLDPDARFGRGSEVALDKVPPRLLSEILRDVDLFTSVASIGLDPGWQDAGPDAPPPGAWRLGADAYWNWAQGAELSASAETRRLMLSVLLPGMELGRVATLEDRHLVVTGKRSRYRIHLGSAAVHDMSSDRHLCIVPSRDATPTPVLRLEGDEILSAILSKAMLLARDDRITDPAILRQLE